MQVAFSVFFPIRPGFSLALGVFRCHLHLSTRFSTPCEDTSSTVCGVLLRLLSPFLHPDGAGTVELADDAQVGGVLIDAQENARPGCIWGLQTGRDCAEVGDVSVGFHCAVGVCVFHNDSSCRPARLWPTLLPSSDRYAYETYVGA